MRAGDLEVLGTFADGRLKLRRWMEPMNDKELAESLVAEWKRYVPGDPEAPKLTDLIAAALSAARREEREAILLLIPGGQICDPQEIADSIRARDVSPASVIRSDERGDHAQ